MKNPLKGLMPETQVKSRGSKVWMIVPILLALWVGKEVAAGIFVGTVFVLFLMYTVEQMPGFWIIAQNAWGRLFIALGTSYVLHSFMGKNESVMAFVATGWSGLLKIVLLMFEAKRLEQEKQVRLANVANEMEHHRKHPVTHVSHVRL